jgi:hypothetical protein
MMFALFLIMLFVYPPLALFGAREDWEQAKNGGDREC